MHLHLRNDTTIDDATVIVRLANGTSVQAPSLYTPSHKRMIQTIATVFSCISLIAISITFACFWRMQKQLRHKLIMLNILGSFVRSIWYFTFGMVVMSGVSVTTPSAFCQSTGFFLNVGNGITDVSILFIAIHGAVRVFRPQISHLHLDFLDAHRFAVYAAILIIPLIISSLAFINPESGYTSQGAFCGLPPRPIWYRLALAWIPRYIISIAIIVLAAAVYLHTGLKFRKYDRTSRELSYASLSRRLSVFSTGANSLNSQMFSLQSLESPSGRPARCMSPSKGPNEDDDVFGNTTPAIVGTSSRQTDPDSSRQPTDTAELDYVNRRPSIATVLSSDATAISPRRTSCLTADTSKSPTPQLSSSKASSIKYATLPHPPAHLHSQRQPITPPESPTRSPLSPLQTPDTIDPVATLSATRTQLQRRVRLIFVYPLLYVLMWIPPFALHVLTAYTDRYMFAPPAWLAVVGTVALTAMGAVDCGVFCWREGIFKGWGERLRGVDFRRCWGGRRSDG